MNKSGMLEELIELLGTGDAMRLCLRHGGEHIYFGSRKPAWVDLSADKAALLRQRFAGDMLVVPLAKESLARWLMETEGLSIAQVAARLRVSHTSVRRWLNPAPKQPSLFEGL